MTQRTYFVTTPGPAGLVMTDGAGTTTDGGGVTTDGGGTMTDGAGVNTGCGDTYTGAGPYVYELLLYPPL